MIYNATDLLLWGLVVHLFCDWILQNDWMAKNKTSLYHPAAWIHGGIHGLGMLLIFPVLPAIILGLSHMLIDLRVIMVLWRQLFRQTQEGVFAIHVAIWGDQVVHISIIAFIAWALK